MSPNTKERLIQSAAGGAVIPASYFVGLAVLDALSLSIPSSWLVLPVLWPVFAFEYHFPALADDLWFFTRTEGLLLLLAANFVLYSLLTYAVIRWRQRMPRLR